MNKKKKILIVEDELLIAKVMMMQFQNRGFEVFHVPEAEKAIEITKQIHPDLIIMDIHLQNNSSGIVAAQKIREAKFDIPIIFTTGNSLANTLENISNIKYSKALSKPIDFDQLLLQVNNF